MDEEGRVGVETSVFEGVEGWSWILEEDVFSSASVRRIISSWTDLRNSCMLGTVVSRGTSPIGGKVDGRSL